MHYTIECTACTLHENYPDRDEAIAAARAHIAEPPVEGKAHCVTGTRPLHFTKGTAAIPVIAFITSPTARPHTTIFESTREVYDLPRRGCQ